jgi:hypothetical protein
VNYKLITAYLQLESALAALNFRTSWDDSDFEDIAIDELETIQETIKEVLDSGVFSERYAPEVQSYFDDLTDFLNS